MISTDQNLTPNSQSSNGQPKRFLRKGEGLKRFAAYKPPLPTTVKKVERRRTFVKFNLDHQSSKREPALHFLPPEILNDDSINLSTEIPKIAPPKIIHTPIRPNRHALGALTNRYPDDAETSSILMTDSRISGNIDNLFKKIEAKKSILEHEYQQYNDSFAETPAPKESHEIPKRQQSTRNIQTKHLKHKQQVIDDDTDDSACGSNSPSLARPLGRTIRVESKSDLSNPLSGTCILALNKRIEQIESIVNELEKRIEKCACGASKSLESSSTEKPTTRSRRPVTRAAAKAAKSHLNDDSDKTTKTKKATNDGKSDRPSADADKSKSTKEVLSSLIREFAEMKAQMGPLLKSSN